MVEARLLGTAFGVCTTFQNLGTVIAPPVLGWIIEETKDHDYGYFWTSVFFIIISFMAFMFNVCVYMYDKKKRDNLLQTTSPLENFERYTQSRITS
jgi:sugar phosphate permease